MVRKWLVALCLLGAACSPKTPTYNETITVSENDAVWEVRMTRSMYANNNVGVELEYANRAGASFSIKRENLMLTDTEGNKWLAESKFPYIPLLQPGGTEKIRAVFTNVVVTGKPLYVHPFNDLVHKEAKFMVKDVGDTPLPGDHLSERWDVVE